MAGEKQNGLFLWRASLGGRHGGWGSPINEDLLDNRKCRAMEEREKIAKHDEERNRFLHHELQEVLYIKKAFELSIAELVDHVLREDEKMNDFPNHSYKEIYNIMTNKGRPC